MKGLRIRVLNDIESTRGLATKMAKLAGYASAAKFKEMLRKEDGEIEKFDGFVRVIHELYPDEKFIYMGEFAKTLNPNRMTARFMLEYATLYKLMDLKKYLINKLYNCSSDESKDWAFVYEIDHKTARGNMDNEDAVELLTKRKYQSYEMEIFSKIVLFYCYNDLKDVLMMRAICDDLQESLENVKNDFAKSCYFTRFYLINNIINLHDNNTSKIKEHVFLIESSLEPIKVSAYLALGNSFLLDNYLKSHEYLMKAYERCETPSYKAKIIQSLNFLCILNEKFDDYIADGDESNLLFMYCKMRNIEKATEIIENLDMNSMSDLQKGFNYYYRGLLYNNEEYFYKSIFHFNECNDKYYKKLSILELVRLGEKEYKTQALYA